MMIPEQIDENATARTARAGQRSAQTRWPLRPGQEGRVNDRELLSSQFVADAMSKAVREIGNSSDALKSIAQGLLFVAVNLSFDNCVDARRFLLLQIENYISTRELYGASPDSADSADSLGA
jgi:hypothetical protein